MLSVPSRQFSLLSWFGRRCGLDSTRGGGGRSLLTLFVPRLLQCEFLYFTQILEVLNSIAYTNWLSRDRIPPPTENAVLLFRLSTSSLHVGSGGVGCVGYDLKDRSGG